MISVTPIKAFNDNYHWLIEGNDEIWVVDPGDAQVVREALKNKAGSLNGILVTHHHWDHVNGIEALISEGIAVAGPAKSQHPLVNLPLSDGDSLALCGETFEVFEVPGHTLNHIAYFCAPTTQNPILFSGDTLFAGGCGRLFEGTPSQMHQSLSRLAELPEDTQVYCAHEYTLANLDFAISLEPNNQLLKERIADAQNTREKNLPTIPSTLKLEIGTNPFLRTKSNELKSRLLEQGVLTSEAPEEIFAAIRLLKDKY